MDISLFCFLFLEFGLPNLILPGLIYSDAATGDILWKKLFLKISKYSKENTCKLNIVKF